MTSTAATLRRDSLRGGACNQWPSSHFQARETRGQGEKKRIKQDNLINFILRFRYLLESLSGVLTGSIYHDLGMANKFLGELGKF